VRSQIEPVGRFDRSVESTVYFCCLEALQNADKHAPGAAVTIGLHVDEVDRLCLEVRDEGPGFDGDLASAGHGLVNMADRAGSLGGDLLVDGGGGGGGSGGMTVVVRIPVVDARRPVDGAASLGDLEVPA
jgi:signal transduction histidine kinase